MCPNSIPFPLPIAKKRTIYVEKYSFSLFIGKKRSRKRCCALQTNALRSFSSKALIHRHLKRSKADHLSIRTHSNGHAHYSGQFASLTAVIQRVRRAILLVSLQNNMKKSQIQSPWMSFIEFSCVLLHFRLVPSPNTTLSSVRLLWKAWSVMKNPFHGRISVRNCAKLITDVFCGIGSVKAVRREKMRLIRILKEHIAKTWSPRLHRQCFRYDAVLLQDVNGVVSSGRSG